MQLQSMTIEVLLGLAFACHLASAQQGGGTDPILPTPSGPPIQNPPSTPPVTAPDLASGMAYASDGTKLYIQGGVSPTNIQLKQFYYLDLSNSWPVNAPAWKNLIEPPFSGTSGTLTLDPSKRFIVTEQQQSNIYIYEPNGSSPTGSGSSTQGTWTTFPIGKQTISSTGPILTTKNVNVNGTEQIYYFGSDSSFTANLSPGSLQASLIPIAISSTSANIAQGAGAVSTSTMGVIRAESSNLLNMDVQLFNDTSQKWTSLNPAGSPPVRRIGHCFVPNNDGSKYYLFGGLDNSSNPLSDLYSFDINARNWTQLADSGSGNSRSSMACAVAGDTFIVWGGLNPVQNIPVLYSITTNTWGVQQFVAPTGNPARSEPPGGQTLPDEEPSGKGGSSNIGAIVGGVVGGIAVVAAVLGFLFIRRRKSAKNGAILARSGGKSEISQGSIEMGGYKSIPSPFKSDEGYQQQVVVGGSPYNPQSSFPTSSPSPSLGMATGVHQYQHGPPILSRPMDPMTHPRAQSQMSNVSPPIIQSPFEVEPDMSSQHLLMNSAPLVPRQLHSAPLPPAPMGSGPYHDRQFGEDQETTTALSRSMEPATVDLIPITASEAGEGSQASRSNSLVSTREPRGTASRSKSRRDGGSGEGAAAGSGALLHEQEESRRDSAESLDYLDIS
ncbi:Leucine-zipper-like transcriptional regulator 1 [Mortierella sp. AD094]|nr:Leucine-zipper-like transcriptional regulator 1 [Mortierella sp. AD094]